MKPFETEISTYEFRLIDHVHKVGEDRFVVHLVDMKLGPNLDFAWRFQPDPSILFPEPPEFSLQQFGIDDMAHLPKMSEEWNRAELSRAYAELDKETQRLEKLPHSSSLEARVMYLQEVIGRFLIWYHANGFSARTTEEAGKVAPKETSPRPTESTLRFMEGENPLGAHASPMDQAASSEGGPAVHVTDEKDITIAIQAKTIKALRQTTVVLRKRGCDKPTMDELKEYANANRKKNGSISFAKLGRAYGRDHKTVKRWCVEYGIK